LVAAGGRARACSVNLDSAAGWRNGAEDPGGGLEQHGITPREELVTRIYEAAKKIDRVLCDQEILALAGAA